MAAPRFSMEVEGLAELRETLQKILPDEAEKILAGTVFEVAKRVEQRMFRHLQSFSVKGRSLHSLRVRKRKTRDRIAEAAVRGGATAPYLLMLEFGTRRTKAKPFITPAVEEVRPDLPAIYRAEFAAVLEKALARKRKRAARRAG